jgi:hypothetical protein
LITAKNSTTFEASVSHGLTRAPIIALGGKNKDTFAPNINMGFSFKGDTEERFINLNRVDKSASTSIEKCAGGIIVDKTDQYLIDAAGNLKWNFILPEKPKSPRIRLKVNYSDGMQFSHQGTLEDDWKTDSMGLSIYDYVAQHNRPIDMVDSIAVYINKANNEYRTGKIAHWHRVIMYDKAGNVGFGKYEWIDKNTVDIVLDEKYLESVEAGNTWPVLVDPTIGYSSVGGSTINISSAYTAASMVAAADKHTAASGDKITKFYVYGKYSGSVSTIDVAAYSWGPSYTASRLASPVTITFSATAGWHASADVSQDLVESTVYVVALGGFVGTTTINYDTLSNCNDYNNATALPATWTHGGFVNYRDSVYADYTESAGGHPAMSRFNHINRNSAVRYA